MVLIRDVVLSLTVFLAFGTSHVSSESYESVMGIINTQNNVKLNPAVQHIPLDPTKADLRPPPPHIPDKYDIFVGLSAFRDGQRCGKTIFTGFKRSKNPDRLYFGVVDQVNANDDKCIDAYCAMAKAEWPEHGPCRYRDQIRIDQRKADDSRGPTLARHYQQKLIQDQVFCLQLDSHSIFTNLWDENLIAEWKRIDNEMAILTTYLHHLHDFIKENGDNTYPGSLPHLCTTIRGGNGCVRNEGASMITGSKFPQLGALWGAGLSFGKCHAEKRVPIDSHTLWMFDGEEFLRASHLWTYGYDLYSPSELGSVIYHNYSKVPARFENVKVDYNQKEIETEMGVNRFFLIVNKPFKGRVDTFEMDKYKYGTVRTFQEYLNFSGITFEEGKNDTNSCNQLHWVPYSDPSEVEKLVGRGWKLYPNKDVKAPSIDIKAPTMKDPTVIDGETHGAGARGDVLTEDHAVVIDQKLRQAGNGERERQNPPVGTGTVMFFFFIVIFILFAYANDTTWYAITRQFRTKTGAANK